MYEIFAGETKGPSLYIQKYVQALCKFAIKSGLPDLCHGSILSRSAQALASGYGRVILR